MFFIKVHNYIQIQWLYTQTLNFVSGNQEAKISFLEIPKFWKLIVYEQQIYNILRLFIHRQKTAQIYYAFKEDYQRQQSPNADSLCYIKSMYLTAGMVPPTQIIASSTLQ